MGPETRIFISVAEKPGRFGATVYQSLFREFGIDAVYLPRKAPPNARHLCESLVTLGISGCSVSMPLKSKVLEFLNELDSSAAMAESVNTIVNLDGRLYGYNTDIAGIAEVLKISKPESVLIYGSGSLVGSALVALRDSPGVRRISIAARNSTKAGELAKKFSSRLKMEIDLRSLESIDEKEYEFLVNATPSSNESDDHEIFRALEKIKSAVFDSVVSPKATKLITRAVEKNLNAISGTTMCVYQIRKQFSLYFGFLPELGKIEKALENYFSN